MLSYLLVAFIVGFLVNSVLFSPTRPPQDAAAVSSGDQDPSASPKTVQNAHTFGNVGNAVSPNLAFDNDGWLAGAGAGNDTPSDPHASPPMPGLDTHAPQPLDTEITAYAEQAEADDNGWGAAFAAADRSRSQSPASFSGRDVAPHLDRKGRRAPWTERMGYGTKSPLDSKPSKLNLQAHGGGRVKDVKTTHKKKVESTLCDICIRPVPAGGLEIHKVQLHGAATGAATEPRKETHTCEVCGEMSDTRVNLRSHKKAQHSWALMCDLCVETFPTAHKALEHYQLYHKANVGFDGIQDFLHAIRPPVATFAASSNSDECASVSSSGGAITPDNSIGRGIGVQCLKCWSYLPSAATLREHQAAMCEVISQPAHTASRVPTPVEEGLAVPEPKSRTTHQLTAHAASDTAVDDERDHEEDFTVPATDTDVRLADFPALVSITSRESGDDISVPPKGPFANGHQVSHPLAPLANAWGQRKREPNTQLGSLQRDSDKPASAPQSGQQPDQYLGQQFDRQPIQQPDQNPTQELTYKPQSQSPQSQLAPAPAAALEPDDEDGSDMLMSNGMVFQMPSFFHDGQSGPFTPFGTAPESSNTHMPSAPAEAQKTQTHTPAPPLAPLQVDVSPARCAPAQAIRSQAPPPALPRIELKPAPIRGGISEWSTPPVTRPPEAVPEPLQSWEHCHPRYDPPPAPPVTHARGGKITLADIARRPKPSQKPARGKSNNAKGNSRPQTYSALQPKFDDEWQNFDIQASLGGQGGKKVPVDDSWGTPPTGIPVISGSRDFGGW